MRGNYVYGVIIGGGDAALGVRGLAGNSPVYAITHEGLSGVVSDYAGGNFDSMSKEELACCLLTHQMVVEQVIRKHPMLPVKFGTVLATANEVGELLVQGHAQFFLTLLWIQDKVELEVVANLAGGRVIEEEATALEALPAEEPPPPEDSKASGRPRQGYLEKMIGFLQPVSVDVQPHPPAPGVGAMSVAFLVDRASMDAFYERIKQLNALFYNKIEFQAVGPLPPYSFATVEVNRLDEEAIDEAKRLLNLSEVVGEVEVRQACRRLAAEDGARASELCRASDLLVAYCREKPEKKGRFLISIRRSRADEVQPLHLVEIGA
jgi:hypothetical protein